MADTTTPTIMVVEDELLLLQAITKKLKITGMDVLSCASGQQAVDYLNNLDKLPDAIWLDYYLKDMNGLAFMQVIKANPKWANIPVLVVSNSASPEKVHNMLALGARKYLLKAEYRLDEIITLIQEFINDAKDAATIAPTATPTITPPPSASAVDSDSPAPNAADGQKDDAL